MTPGGLKPAKTSQNRAHERVAYNTPTLSTPRIEPQRRSMARIVPDDWKNLEATGAAVRELETLALLEKLPDDYTVYHGVHWTRINEGFSVFGEADFVVVAPSGRVLVIEQKAGFLRETPAGSREGLSAEGTQRRDPACAHARKPASALHGRVRRGHVSHRRAAVLPRLHGEGRVDSGRACGAYRRCEPQGASCRRWCWRSCRPTSRASNASARIHHFLADELALTPDTNALVGQADMLVTRLSGGLATWARGSNSSRFACA